MSMPRSTVAAIVVGAITAVGIAGSVLLVSLVWDRPSNRWTTTVAQDWCAEFSWKIAYDVPIERIDAIRREILDSLAKAEFTCTKERRA